MTDESIKRYAHYSTEQLERFLREVERQNGDTLPGLLGDVQAELERRRARSAPRTSRDDYHVPRGAGEDACGH